MIQCRTCHCPFVPEFPEHVVCCSCAHADVQKAMAARDLVMEPMWRSLWINIYTSHGFSEEHAIRMYEIGASDEEIRALEDYCQKLNFKQEYAQYARHM